MTRSPVQLIRTDNEAQVATAPGRDEARQSKARRGEVAALKTQLGVDLDAAWRDATRGGEAKRNGRRVAGWIGVRAASEGEARGGR